MKSCTQAATYLLYPHLRRVPPERRGAVLEKARGEAFDAIEIAAIACGVAFVAWLLSPGAADTQPLPLPVHYLIQFVAAVPLLAIVVGPFLLRRTRRGIERELRRYPS